VRKASIFDLIAILRIAKKSTQLQRSQSLPFSFGEVPAALDSKVISILTYKELIPMQRVRRCLYFFSTMTATKDHGNYRFPE
jgi:hypothetical protein